MRRGYHRRELNALEAMCDGLPTPSFADRFIAFLSLKSVLMGLAVVEWKLHVERRPHALDALDPHTTPVAGDDLLDQVEANAQSAHCTVQLTRTIKPLEDMFTPPA